MSCLKPVILILSVSCCSSHFLRPNIISKGYNFGNKQVIVGKNSIHDTAFVYAICEGTCLNRMFNCTLNFESDVFDDSKLKSSCDFYFETEILNGKLEILEVNFWGQDKAIFVWRDTNNNNVRHSKVTINVVTLGNCNLKAHKIRVDNRYDQKPQIFITPYKNSYDVVFMDENRCGNKFCKVNVRLSGAASEAVGWFRNTGLVSALEPIGNGSKKLLITNYRKSGEGRDVVLKAYFLGRKRRQELLALAEDSEIAWSTTNGIISICSVSLSNCWIFNQDGSFQVRRGLYVPEEPTMYLTLYNTPQSYHLALICTTNIDGNYTIFGTCKAGFRLYRYSVEGLSCALKYNVLIGTFSVKSEMEYCLSLFFSVPDTVDEYKFNKYCFPI